MTTWGRALLGLFSALALGACGGGMANSSTAQLPGGPTAAATLSDVTIEVAAVAETTLAEVSFQIETATQTVAGGAVTPDSGGNAPVVFTFSSLDSGTHTLKTSWGNYAFTVAEDKTITSSQLDVEGGVRLVIPNVVPDNLGSDAWDTLTVDAVNDTSVNEMAFRLESDNNSSLPANRQIGDTQVVDGTDAADGVTWDFRGMVAGQRFKVRTLWGTATFVIDGAGNLSVFNPATDGLLVDTSASRITWQNTVSFDPLHVPAVNDTNMAQVAYQFQTLNNPSSFPSSVVDRFLGDVQTVDGVDAAEGITQPFLGMALRQEFLLRTSWGDIYFNIDDDGKLVARPDDTSPYRFSFSGDTMTLQNTISHKLKVYTQENDPAPGTTTFKLRSQQGAQILDLAGRTIDSDQTVDHGALATGVTFDVLGMLVRQRLRVFTEGLRAVGSAIEVGYEPQFDGTAVWSSNVTEDNGSSAAVAYVQPPPPDAPTDPTVDNKLIVEIVPLNTPPEADAGSDVMIQPSEQATTSLTGTASDADGDTLTCTWLLGGEVVAGPDTVTGGTCTLALSTLDPLAPGNHTFTFLVSDGQAEATDTVVVTVKSAPPLVAAGGAGTFYPDTEVVLAGTISDADGDLVTYEWRFEGEPLFPEDVIQTIAGGQPVNIPKRIFPGSVLGLGVHTLELVADDGTNEEVKEAIIVEVIDTPRPLMCPNADDRMLWPLDGQLHSTIVWSNAVNKCGSPLSIAVEVTYTDDTGVIPEYVIDRVSVEKVELRLRAVPGRIYTVHMTISCGDKESSVDTVIKVPVRS